MRESYSLTGVKNNKKKTLLVEANDSNHAQAQSFDIARALSLESSKLDYCTENKLRYNDLSRLFCDLAFNNFQHASCSNWEGSFCNGHPVVYVFGERLYLRNLILDYMDIKKDNIVKMECENKGCVNPYHFSYKTCKAQKMSSGDLKLMLAFASQGVSVKQIAKALNIHRSTVYRNLNHERLHAGP